MPLDRALCGIEQAQHVRPGRAAPQLHQGRRRAAHQPSVISKRMKELEDSLGFSLVNRSTHGVVLTDAGDGLFQHCLEILAKLDNYVTERRNIETGPLARCAFRRRATTPIRSHPLVNTVRAARPGVRVHLAAVPDHLIPAENGFDVIAQRPEAVAARHCRPRSRRHPPRDLRLTRLFSQVRPAKNTADPRAQLSRRPVLGSEELAVPQFTAYPARRGERIAVVQQQRRSLHPDGSRRRRDRQSAAAFRSQGNRRQKARGHPQDRFTLAGTEFPPIAPK